MAGAAGKLYQDPEANEKLCLEKLSRLVELYGYGTVRNSLNQLGLRSVAPKKRAGRPAEFDYGRYMELWLFVEEGHARCGLSIQAFCKISSYAWFTAGLPEGHPDYKTPFTTIIKGNTLRRRYYKAVSFLKSDADLRVRSSISESTFAGNPQKSIEAIWKEELQQRLMTAA